VKPTLYSPLRRPQCQLRERFIDILQAVENRDIFYVAALYVAVFNRLNSYSPLIPAVRTAGYKYAHRLRRFISKKIRALRNISY
jgi:hypothetical protein